ncbi:MAG TPA: hypothetical protein DCE42_22925, partial [Myxococcales bacterium]|nr:hypothetical protein [Myxococcales bacterium]
GSGGNDPRRVWAASPPCQAERGRQEQVETCPQIGSQCQAERGSRGKWQLAHRQAAGGKG